MSKIKEERMKDLEKFGFKLKFNNIIHTAYYVRPVDFEAAKLFLKDKTIEGNRQILENNDVVAIVTEKYNPCLDRYVFIIKKERCKDLEYPFSEINEEYIQDLIKADMVEKVVEDGRI